MLEFDHTKERFQKLTGSGIQRMYVHDISPCLKDWLNEPQICLVLLK